MLLRNSRAKQGAQARLPVPPKAELLRLENRFSFRFRWLAIFSVWSVAVRDSRRLLLRCSEGAEMAEKLAIRKCFLVCCEGDSSISNNGRLAIRNCVICDWKVRRCCGTAKQRQKLAIDLGWWCFVSVSCAGFRLCFASD